jgi:hypothetical protein
MDEVTELSLFAGMQVTREKPKYPLPNPLQLFNQIAITSVNNKKELDLKVLEDVVVYADTMLKGRIFKSG